jgi:CBS domain-containing protein
VKRAREDAAGAATTPSPPSAKRAQRGGPVKGVLTCQATSTLGEVLAIMATRGVHTVYAVDPDSKPLSAVTAADVLRVAADAATGGGGGGGRPESRVTTPVPLGGEALLARSSRLESVSGASDVVLSERAPSMSQVQSVTSGQSNPGVVTSADLGVLRPL